VCQLMFQLNNVSSDISDVCQLMFQLNNVIFPIAAAV